MGIQVIVKTNAVNDIESALGTIAPYCEIFSIDEGNWGISIPAKVINDSSEKNVRILLNKLEYFDLWSGSWSGTSTARRYD